MRARAVLTIVLSVAAASCARTLPAQDRRILSATAMAKMPIEDLAKEYAANAGSARAKYWGHAVEVSGNVTPASGANAASMLVFVDRNKVEIADAALLDDAAPQILAAVKESPRVRIKCFADEFAARVHLRSCVQP